MNSRIKFLITRAWIVFALVSLASAQSYKVIRMGSLTAVPLFRQGSIAQAK